MSDLVLFLQILEWKRYRCGRHRISSGGPALNKSKTTRVRADFNGLFGNVLCLSHTDSCEDADGKIVTLIDGMALTAFDIDVDEEGKRDDLVACGVVEPAPDWLCSHGSRWVLRIDPNGVRHESELGSST